MPASKSSASPAEQFCAEAALLESEDLPSFTVDVTPVAPARAHVDVIEIPEAFRGRGYGRQILDFLCATADRYGVTLDLQPEEGCGAAFSVEAWYRRHGFVDALDEVERIQVLRRVPLAAVVRG